jgi:hypothetical protein
LKNQLIKNKYWEDNSISHNVNITTPMPWTTVSAQPLENGIDGVLVTGSEYLTSITVLTYNPSLTIETSAGDCIYSVPIHPKFFSGTRLLALARLYQKYKYRRLIFEYIPTVPSTQSGSLLMFMTYDPEQNIFVLSDEDTRLREAMSHTGAQMFNVYTYGRCHLDDDKQLDWYDFETGNEPRFEMQGVFNIMAASIFDPITVDPGDLLTLGNIVIHYEIELVERGLTDDPSTTLNLTWQNGGSTAWNTVFDPNFLLTTGPCAISQSYWASLFGGPLSYEYIIVAIPQIPLNTTGGLHLVKTQNTPSTYLFGAGSVWYLYPWFDSANTWIGVSDSLSTALLKEKDTYLLSAVTGTDLIQFKIPIRAYKLSR